MKHHTENFFEEWDLSKGICVIEQNDKIVHHVEASQSIRSPTAKYYNCQAMLLDGGYFPDNDVINTGIIGASAEHIKQLAYFDGLEHVLEMMTSLRSDAYREIGIYPENIIDMFRYDNETIFSYKIRVNEVPVQWLAPRLALLYLISKGSFQAGHALYTQSAKTFDCVWRRYDA